MARKELIFTPTDGRDKENGMQFKITEMPAAQAERWAMRAIMAIMKSGMELPDDFEKNGMAGLAQLGIRAISSLDWPTAEPLLDEMMSCVTVIGDPSKPQITRPLLDSDIEEVQTRLKLRLEVLKLHVDFTATAEKLKSTQHKAVGKNAGLGTKI